MSTNKINMTAGLFTAFAHESLTISNSAKSLTSATYTDSDSEIAKRAIITVESAQIRYTYEGTTPTSSVGHLLNPFDVLTIIGKTNIENFQAIRAGGSDATIKVTYEN